MTDPRSTVNGDLPGGQPGPRRGRRLGVDVGGVRIGVASSDPDGILATPVTTVRRTPDADTDITELVALAQEYDAVEVIVGQPRDLRGELSIAAAAVGEFAAALERALGPEIPVRLTDERMTTVVASRALRASGRGSRQQRSVVDQAAAVEILQGWLDARRAAAARGDLG